MDIPNLTATQLEGLKDPATCRPAAHRAIVLHDDRNPDSPLLDPLTRDRRTPWGDLVLALLTLNENEQRCLDQAAHFVVARLRPRQRQQVAALEDALALARTFGDRRSMIYAVTPNGRDAHILNA